MYMYIKFANKGEINYIYFRKMCNEKYFQFTEKNNFKINNKINY